MKLLALLPLPLAAQPLPAFPGAEGFGADTPGGRGGRILQVTTLADSGPGSFREALLTPEPRIIVFRVGGTIELESRILLTQAHSFVTVAGQTAPGDGIQIKGWDLFLHEGFHDGVFRHLRIRPGATGPNEWSKHTIYL